MSWTQGVHHVGLTVPNVRKVADFFVNVLKFSEVGGRPEYPAIFVSDSSILITLWQASEPDQARAFDRKNTIGLHHLALQVADSTSLEALHTHLLKTPDVTIEFAPEPLGALGTHMMCHIPGGIRVEFIAV